MHMDPPEGWPTDCERRFEGKLLCVYFRFLLEAFATHPIGSAKEFPKIFWTPKFLSLQHMSQEHV